jgi:hypothetical protein
VGSATALGRYGRKPQIATGAELLFDGAAITFAVSEPLQIAVAGAGDGRYYYPYNAHNPTLSGPVTLSADATITVSSTATGQFTNHERMYTSLQTRI